MLADSVVIPTRSMIKYLGLSITSISIRPIYSPIIPIRMNSTPNKKEIMATEEAHPGKAEPETSLEYNA
jgi:hypothetical protein